MPSLAALKEWLKKARSMPLRDIVATLRRKLQGYWNYYGVIGNSETTSDLRAWCARWLVYKWLNRRSQRQKLHVDGVHGRLGALEDAVATRHREAMAASPLDKTSRAPYEMVQSNRSNHDRAFHLRAFLRSPVR